MQVFDAHFHVIDPRYPMVANQGYLPERFSCSDYVAACQGIGVSGGAIVSGSFHGYEQRYLMAALKSLGGSYVGVAQLPYRTPDHELLSLHESGVRAVRFNFRRGCVSDMREVVAFANRVHVLCGWHAEFYIGAQALAELEPVLLSLPCVVIDHLGLDSESEGGVLRIASAGGYVKATGFGRLEFPVVPRLKAVYDVNPEALLFGTDLPSTRSPKPFTPTDIDMLLDHFDSEAIHKIMWQNATSLYRPSSL